MFSISNDPGISVEQRAKPAVSIGAEYANWTMSDPQFGNEDLAEGKSPKKEDGLGAVGIRGSKSRLTC